MPRSKPARLVVLGIMSGTSIDGVDYASCQVTPDRVRLMRHWHVEFPARLRERLHRAARGDCSSHETGQLHHDLGRFYAAGANAGGGPGPQLVGLHGQTLFHHPDRRAPATLQIGEPAYLVETLRVPVVSNFRSADMAAGGQGAPLATLFHRVVFARLGRHVCVNNLGGISNVTSLDWRCGDLPEVSAFDTGPANVLLDLAIRHFTHGRRSFDAGGRWSARGRVAAEPLRHWLRHRYFRRRPPKSTGRELFGEQFLKRALRELAGRSKFEILATLAEFAARSLALNYERHLDSIPQRVILTGGGAANLDLVKRIRQSLRERNPRTSVVTSEEEGWPLQSVEPAAFALLAAYRWWGRAGNLPATTGAAHPVLCGQIAEPR